MPSFFYSPKSQFYVFVNENYNFLVFGRTRKEEKKEKAKKEILMRFDFVFHIPGPKTLRLRCP